MRIDDDRRSRIAAGGSPDTEYVVHHSARGDTYKSRMQFRHEFGEIDREPGPETPRTVRKAHRWLDKAALAAGILLPFPML